MRRFVLSAMNFGGTLLVAIGVFTFALALSGKSFNVGAFKFQGTSDLAFFFIALGLILFAASFLAEMILKNN